MRLQLTLAAAGFAALILASPSNACGNGECDPSPPSPPPVVVDPKPPVVVKPPPSETPVVVDPKPPVFDGSPDTDRDPHVVASVIHFAWCCEQDGQPAWKTALFRDPVQAALQCQARALRYEEGGQSLPACPHRKAVTE